ncbi:hypothetical protein Bca4012_065195 [Brassica carinata]
MDDYACPRHLPVVGSTCFAEYLVLRSSRGARASSQEMLPQLSGGSTRDVHALASLAMYGPLVDVSEPRALEAPYVLRN